MSTTPYYSLQGSGKPLVFQHGLGANHTQVTGLLSGLNGIQLLASDSRGHGKTPYDPGRQSSFSSFTNDVVRLIDKLQWDKAIVGGISMGSGIALNMALRYPDRVAALILLRPAWLCGSIPENLRILLDVAAFADKSQEIEGFKNLPEFRKIAAEVPNAAASVLGMFDRDQQIHTSEILKSMVGDHPCVQDPSDITVPALIIGNEDDPLHPWEMAQTWHKILPKSQLLKVTSRYLDAEKHQNQVTEGIQNFINEITV